MLDTFEYAKNYTTRQTRRASNHHSGDQPVHPDHGRPVPALSEGPDMARRNTAEGKNAAKGIASWKKLSV